MAENRGGAFNSDRGSFDLESRTGSSRSRHMQTGMFPFEAFDFDSPKREENPKMFIKSPWQFGLENLAAADPGIAGIIYRDADGFLKVSL